MAPLSRPVVWSLFALLVVIWSSTWVAIKVGLEETPPLLGAGVRFAAAGLLLLAITAVRRRSLQTDVPLALLLAALPFATAYGLIYWGEQHIPSGLAAVLFGAMPLYVALLATRLLPDERVTPRLVGGFAVALAGLAVGFSESLELGDDDLALAGAVAVSLSPVASAAGNVAIKRRAARLDAVVLNGWAMLAAGAVLLLLAVLAEDVGAAAWSAQALGAIGYLAVVGSAVPFVVLTVLLGRLPATTMAVLPLLLPFGALALGAAVYDEALTGAALAGAALVGAGLLVAQWPARRTLPDAR
jgi:drug/metabolite transporter (DMT)-like permease